MSNETDKKKEVLYPDLGQRLAQLIEMLGLNQRQFALKVEANPQVVSHLMGGYAIPSGKTLMLIADRWPGFNASWLLTGTGEPFTSGPYARNTNDGRALSPAPVAAAVAPVGRHGAELVETARALAENEFLKQTLLSQNQQIASLQATVERLLDMLPVGKLSPDNYAAEAPVMYTTTPTQPAGFKFGQSGEPEAFALMSVDGRLYGGLHGGLLSVVGISEEKAA